MAPFIRTRVLTAGTFGVSHTRVPTESRPGHVAMIAGLYEDVSSVTTGWQLNPVNFDSVFNRSTHTWSWGSPDILPMFSTGATPGRVTDYTYSPELEDNSKDAKELDYWVFNHVKDFFDGADSNHTLAHELQQDGNVFFLHLLGLDTTGHSHRPYSREYLHNIQVVDEGVRQTTELIDRYFGDDGTAYVFTADHGMSDWGSHGDGHPDNTRTPLVVWGSGVAKPRTVSEGIAAGHEDGFSSDWGFGAVQRNDVAQADIAPLMAYLVGLDFPVNSVGELPLPFLAASEAEKAKAMLVNAQEILEMYRVKEQQKRATVLRYQPFKPLAGPENAVEHQVDAIQTLIDNADYTTAIESSDQLIQVGLQGLRYLQTYNWLFLRTLVTLGYLGWITFAFTTAVDVYVLDSKADIDRSSPILATAGAILVALFSFLLVQASPITYYIYALFPVIFWEEIFARRQALTQGARTLFASWTKADVRPAALNVLFYVVSLEIMVQSYYHRQIYSLVYLVAAAWPFLHGSAFARKHWEVCTIWAVSCACMSIFTFLPALKVEDLSLILGGGFLILILGVLYLVFEQTLLSQDASGKASAEQYKIDQVSRLIFGGQVGLVALAMAVTRSSVTYLREKQGLPLGTQVVGWFTLVASLLLPFAHALRPRDHYLHRLAIVFLAFGPLFIILTISYEGLFYLAISVTLLTWVRLEQRLHEHYTGRTLEQEKSMSTNGDASATRNDAATLLAPIDPSQQEAFRSLALSDTRVCLFFLYLLQSGFFSTGNIASISSFSLDAVYRLIPIFDPFSQGALLSLKLLAPFALVSANLGILTKRLRLRGGSLFVIVMGISDYLTLRFFWEVRDEGSWLDIGESISMFVIASMLCVFVAALEALSEILLRGVRIENSKTPASYRQTSSNGKVPQKAL